VRLSVRTAQILTLLTLLLVTTLVVGGTTLWNARYAVEDLGRQLLDQAATRVRQQVDAVLQVAVEQGAANASLIESGVLPLVDHARMTRFFLAALRARPSLSYLSLGLDSGAYWHVYRDPNGNISVQWLLPNGRGGFDLVDYRPLPDGTLEETYRDTDTKRTPPYERPYYRAALAAGGSTWPETYIFLGAAGAFDIPGVTRATPVRDASGRVRGVLTADFDLLALSRFLQGVKIGDAGLAFVLEERRDGSRRVIAHPDATGRLALTAPSPDGRGSEALPAERVDDPRVHGLLAHLPRNGAVGGFTPVRFEAAGVRYLGGWRALGGSDRPAWRIAMLVPESEVLGRIHDMTRWTILLAVVGIVLVLAAGVLVSNRVSGKLRRIAGETREVAAFRLDARPAERSSIAEIDRLGRAVEEMKSSLRSFQKYVPAELVRSILASGEEARLGGKRRHIAIYFSDVADFTRIAEDLEPELLVDVLADYLGVMTREMLDKGATVDKYIGDAIMAFWGAPGAAADPCWQACRTALANQRQLARLRAEWLERGRPAIRARIGLNFGEAIVGNFGSENRLDYTAIGDTVNLAQRLESLNKVYGTSILMSEAVHREVADRVVARRVDRVAVKGRRGGTLVFELVGLEGEAPHETIEVLRHYEEGLDAYFDRRFEDAIASWARVGALRPDDGPTRVMAARAAEWRATPPPPDWDGVHTARTK